MGTIKSLLKNNNHSLALLAYRTTPLEIGYSPSQLLMSWALRATLPSTRQQREPRVPDTISVRTKDQQLKSRLKKNFDNHHGVRELSHTVWVPDWSSEAQVSNQVDKRSYQIASEDGTFQRNPKDLIVQMQSMPVMTSRIQIIQTLWMQLIQTLEQNNPYVDPVIHSTWAPDRLDPSST